MSQKTTHLLLHNIRSAHNVGSIFRTADAAGALKIFLTGYTPTPSDRHGRTQKEIAKTALGAEGSVVWEHRKHPGGVIGELQKQGVTIVGVEQDERAISLKEYDQPSDICWVFGNEVRGLSAQLRDRCDVLVEIPMAGKKESLNVAVTAGIVLYSHLS